MAQLLKVRASQIPKKFHEECTTLLGMFGVILRIDEQKILIPSQMPIGPPDLIATPTPLQEAEQVDSGSQFRTLSRYWFMNFLPEGFWPRLICRLVVDKVLHCHLEKAAPNPKGAATAEELSKIAPWVAWRKGLIWVVAGRPILEVKEVPNERDVLVQPDGSRKEVLSGDYRLEVHYHLHHCEALTNRCCTDEDQSEWPVRECGSIVFICSSHSSLPHPLTPHSPHPPLFSPSHSSLPSPPHSTLPSPRLLTPLTPPLPSPHPLTPHSPHPLTPLPSPPMPHPPAL